MNGAQAIERATGLTKSSMERMQHMVVSLQYVDSFDVPGDIVECGVWRGGNIILSRLICPSRVVWLYDTFEGMTAPGPHDVKRSGLKPPASKALSKKWTAASLEEVTENLQMAGVWDVTKLRIVKGDVLHTLKHDIIPDQIALLRLDTDWYESTRMELEILFPRLVRGGILIIDDYGHWMGCRKACDDYLGEHAPYYATEFKAVDYTCYYMVKR